MIFYKKKSSWMTSVDEQVNIAVLFIRVVMFDGFFYTKNVSSMTPLRGNVIVNGVLYEK